MVTSDGVRVTMDDDEVRMMAAKGTVRTAEFVRRTVALHLTDGFTDVYATDGSKKGSRAAYGVWAGPGVLMDEAVRRQERAEAEDAVRARVAQGRMGGRLPDGWDVTDAELAGILRALQAARGNDTEGGGEGRRVLICTNSHAAMRLVENAWAAGRHGGGRRDRAGLVTAITEARRDIGREREGGGAAGWVKFVYTPAHSGIAPNAMADAIAKSYLEDNKACRHVLDAVRVAAWHTRPLVYGEGDGGGGWGELVDRRVSAQVRAGLCRWVVDRLGEGGRRRVLVGGEGREWKAVVAAVGKGKGAEMCAGW